MISLYCSTGEPVGSRTLSRKCKMDLSPATIRNVLADLEEMGYIRQPHTSAGRIPTDKGYRFYVNTLMRSHTLNPDEKIQIESAMQDSAGSVQGLMNLTTGLLAHLSHQIALAVAPAVNKLALENIDFVPISSTRVLAVLVIRGGVVSNKIVDLDEPVSHEELIRISNYIRTTFYGMSLPSIRKQLMDLMKQEKTQYDLLLKRAATLGQKTLDQTDQELYVNGASQVVRYPEFSDAKKTHELLEALEEKNKILRILTQCIEGEGIHILIGEDNHTDLTNMSLITSPYRCGDQAVGSLAIFGPTRMEYARLIPLVDHIAKVVSGILTREN